MRTNYFRRKFVKICEIEAHSFFKVNGTLWAARFSRSIRIFLFRNQTLFQQENVISTSLVSSRYEDLQDLQQDEGPKKKERRTAGRKDEGRRTNDFHPPPPSANLLKNRELDRIQSSLRIFYEIPTKSWSEGWIWTISRFLLIFVGFPSANLSSKDRKQFSKFDYSLIP